MNLLIMSPGRRVEVVDYFKEVFHRGGGKVFTLDMSELSPALYFGDEHFVVPKKKSNQKLYVDEVVRICVDKNIEAVITLVDPELILLSQYKDLFDKHDIKLILSDTSFTISTFDKYEFYNKYKDIIKLVDTVDSYDKAIDRINQGLWKYPLFAKLKDGSASIGIRKIYSDVDMEDIKSNPKYIYQPFVKGGEYGIDVYFDLINGNLISAFIKRKIAMRAGETDKSISVLSNTILNEVLKIEGIKGIRGPIDVDVFVSEEGEIFINEINPRFGGGYPHAYRCGVDFMSLIYENLKGKVHIPNFNNYKEGIILLKYNSSIILDGNES